MATPAEQLAEAIARIAPILDPMQSTSRSGMATTTPIDISNAARILGLAEDSDSDAIKRAYRKLSLILHPDKAPGNEAAAAAFRKINNANELLVAPLDGSVSVIEPEPAEPTTGGRRAHTYTPGAAAGARPAGAGRPASSGAGATPPRPPQPVGPSYIPEDIDPRSPDAVLYTLFTLSNIAHHERRERGYGNYYPIENALHRVKVSVTRANGTTKVIHGFIIHYDQTTSTIRYISADMPGIGNIGKLGRRILNRYQPEELKLAPGSIPEIIDIASHLRTDISKRVAKDILERDERAARTRAEESRSAAGATPSARETAPPSTPSQDEAYTAAAPSQRSESSESASDHTPVPRVDAPIFSEDDEPVIIDTFDDTGIDASADAADSIDPFGSPLEYPDVSPSAGADSTGAAQESNKTTHLATDSSQLRRARNALARAQRILSASVEDNQDDEKQFEYATKVSERFAEVERLEELQLTQSVAPETVPTASPAAEPLPVDYARAAELAVVKNEERRAEKKVKHIEQKIIDTEKDLGRANKAEMKDTDKIHRRETRLEEYKKELDIAKLELKIAEIKISIIDAHTQGDSDAVNRRSERLERKREELSTTTTNATPSGPSAASAAAALAREMADAPITHMYKKEKDKRPESREPEAERTHRHKPRGTKAEE